MWLNTVTDAVSACARDPDAAFGWIARVEDDDVTFDALGTTGDEFSSQDAKLRSALSRHATGATGRKHRELVDVISAKSEELKRATLRRQIKGRQILLLVRQFYEVKKDRRI